MEPPGLESLFSYTCMLCLVVGQARKQSTHRLTSMGEVEVEDDGWPLGLGALNARAGLLGAANRSGSPASFDTTNFTSSHCASTLPSTDFDTESAWSLPRPRTRGGVTLASLIGLVDAMESRRRPSARAARSGKLRALLLSLCLRSHLENDSGAPSLGQFLEMERRASGGTSIHVHGI